MHTHMHMHSSRPKPDHSAHALSLSVRPPHHLASPVRSFNFANLYGVKITTLFVSSLLFGVITVFHDLQHGHSAVDMLHTLPVPRLLLATPDPTAPTLHRSHPPPLLPSTASDPAPLDHRLHVDRGASAQGSDRPHVLGHHGHFHRDGALPPPPLRGKARFPVTASARLHSASGDAKRPRAHSGHTANLPVPSSPDSLTHLPDSLTHLPDHLLAPRPQARDPCDPPLTPPPCSAAFSSTSDPTPSAPPPPPVPPLTALLRLFVLLIFFRRCSSP